MAKLTRNPKDIIDLLEDEGLAAFFDLKAELAYFCSIRGAYRRRDRHPHTLARLERWFAVDALRRHEIISEHVIRRRRVPKPNSDTSSILRSLWAKAESFFKPDDLLSDVSLKAAYRRATKFCHPDAGGTHEDMVALNEAFENLHEMVVNNWLDQDVVRDNGDVSGGLGPIAFNPRDLIPSASRPFKNPQIRDGLIAGLWLKILVDEWNLDEAIIIAENKQLFAKFLSASPEIERAELLKLMGTLIDRCYTLNRKDVCEHFVEQFFAALERSIDQYPCFQHLEMIRDRLLETIGGKKRRIILNHPRQRENAERLTRKSLPDERNSPGSDVGMPATLIVAMPFLRLPHEPPTAPRPLDPSRIPYPVHHGRPSQNYSAAQCWEYHQAFYIERSISLVEKHKWARAWSCTLSLVLSDVAGDNVLEELKAIGQMFPDQLGHLSNAASFLKKLGKKRFNTRLRDLRELDKRAREHSYPRPLLDTFWYEPQRLAVGVNRAYAQTIMADDENIVHALRTGCLWTAQERPNYAEQRRKEG